MQKRTILDIDDTILNFSDPMQDFLATKGHVITKRMRDFHNIPKLFDLSLPETLDLVREFHRSPMMGKLPAEPCAKVVLPQLYAQGWSFVAITACLDEPEVHAMRVENLLNEFGFAFERVHCVGLKNDKRAELKSYPSAIWVEDMFNHAVAGAEAGHQAFILDRPYNHHESHPKVQRVTDWYAIAEAIGVSVSRPV
jgi:hypothetical protein